jgi:hypothetical protein
MLIAACAISGNWFGTTPGCFSPQWENSMQPYAARRNQRNGNFYGTNPWSLVKQYRGTQIGLSSVHKDYPFRKLYCLYPLDALRSRIVYPESGWTICHTGRIVFGFRSLKPATKSDDPWPNKSSVTDWYDYQKTAWILEVAEAPPTTPHNAEKTDAIIKRESDQFHQTIKRGTVEVTHLADDNPAEPSMRYTSAISRKTLVIDAAEYPMPADGEGMLTADYPLLATYPDAASAPRLLQQQTQLNWLDGKGKPRYTIDYANWLQKGK